MHQEPLQTLEEVTEKGEATKAKIKPQHDESKAEIMAKKAKLKARQEERQEPLQTLEEVTEKREATGAKIKPQHDESKAGIMAKKAKLKARHEDVKSRYKNWKKLRGRERQRQQR